MAEWRSGRNLQFSISTLPPCHHATPNVVWISNMSRNLWSHFLLDDYSLLKYWSKFQMEHLFKDEYNSIQTFQQHLSLHHQRLYSNFKQIVNLYCQFQWRLTICLKLLYNHWWWRPKCFWNIWIELYSSLNKCSIWNLLQYFNHE